MALNEAPLEPLRANEPLVKTTILPKERSFWQSKELEQLKYRVIQLPFIAQQTFFSELPKRYQLLFLTLLPRKRVAKILRPQRLQARKEMLSWLKKIKAEDLQELQKIYNKFFHRQKIEVNGSQQLKNIYRHLPKEARENIEAYPYQDKHSSALQRLVNRFSNTERALLLSDPRLTYNVLSLLSQSNKILCLQELINYVTLSPKEKQQRRRLLRSNEQLQQLEHYGKFQANTPKEEGYQGLIAKKRQRRVTTKNIVSGV